MEARTRQRFLATTADESSWNPDRPMLFLGEWCRVYSRRSAWESLDASVAPYHWDDREKYFTDYQFLDGVYEERLSRLAATLGRMHGTTDSLRYWRIVIGPWLRFFIDAVYDRHEMIRTVAESGAVEDTTILGYDLSEWVPADFPEFYRQFTADAWNHIVYAEFIRELRVPHTDVSARLGGGPPAVATPGLARKAAQTLFDLYGHFLPRRLNRVAIVAAYIPREQLKTLQLAMGQLPYLFNPMTPAGRSPADSKRRASLAHPGGRTAFERVLDRLIASWMPAAYVEDFESRRNTALSSFPRKPAVMFTANAYQADDGFKMWAAHHVERGARLVIAQHGGNYGIGRANQTEDHQLKIADPFVSWGWERPGFSNIRPMASMKLVDATPAWNPSGDVLMTLASLPRYFYCHFNFPAAGQFLEYIGQQVRFANGLDERARSSLRIRLDADRFGWSVAERLRDAGLGSALDPATTRFATRLAGCRIAVCTYNATVFLETLAMNFPTLIYFDTNFFELRDSAKPAFDRLRAVGIFHDTPESAAAFLNGLGDELGAWWSGGDLQAARRDFCERYARSSGNWLGEWSTMLTGLASARSARP